MILITSVSVWSICAMWQVVLILVVRDTENYTVKNTHDCCAVYVKSMVVSETVHVMSLGNCEVEMTLLFERQMKNTWTGLFVPMEHRQTTTDLSAISTEASFWYQIVLFWHTEFRIPEGRNGERRHIFSCKRQHGYVYADSDRNRIVHGKVHGNLCNGIHRAVFGSGRQVPVAHQANRCLQRPLDAER